MSFPITYLFVPADRPDRFEKALGSGADRVILDLEDAVRPDAKAEARRAILDASLDWGRVVVRINDAASPYFDADFSFLAEMKAAAVMLPKAETVDTLTRVSDAAGCDIEVLPQIETVRGLEAAPELLAHPATRRAVFGHLDFALDLGAEPVWEALLYARSRLVALSRLAGALPPVESVTTAVKDDARLREDTRAARQMGFGGKLLIHPAQVGPAAEAFRPSDAERDWARRVLDVVAQGAAGAVAVDGKMIDKPVEEAARRILARAGELDA
ncbi:HpcH/HpaI aldolase/citrate lyase family protein [Marivita hallyeonensis]|uniref:Citrate lyase subunit beta / citryl-CoA lyase n=1 Tax=Marivita hallyeonensis TaxID=996342 RepID=A0A1M5SBG7_9RHOB|nr:CoA ester lyase [Marivita hallyeonensis]SHH35790.1 citrate lyase subunit beta / citryl-CoA lyase [Marivita hallyeonensis]